MINDIQNLNRSAAACRDWIIKSNRRQSTFYNYPFKISIRFHHVTREVERMKMLLRIAAQFFNPNNMIYASSGPLRDLQN